MSRDETLRCSFCGNTQDEGRNLVGGPSAHICDWCLEFCRDIIEEVVDGDSAPDSDPSMDELEKSDIGCSFCGKPEDEVQGLIVASTVGICHECVARLSPLAGGN